jgi:hypothetical protein
LRFLALALIRNLSRSRLHGGRMLWRVSRPIRTRSKPQGFILPCQPALADRPPAGPGWLHEVKWDGYRVIACKDGERVRERVYGLPDYHSKKKKSPAKRSSPGSGLVTGYQLGGP